jgi:hypothetical protein
MGNQALVDGHAFYLESGCRPSMGPWPSVRDCLRAGEVADQGPTVCMLRALRIAQLLLMPLYLEF